MSMPGFNAELSLYRTRNTFNAACRTSSWKGAVTPALPKFGTGNVWANCMGDCVDGCTGSPTACNTKCRAQCSAGVTAGPGGPPDPTNCNICKGACYTWLAACEADYAVLTDGLGPLAGILVNELGGFVGDPCVYVKDQCLAGCPC